MREPPGPQAGAEKRQPVPAGAPSALRPYIDKKSRSGVGAGCGRSFRVPKVQGFRSLRVEATSCWRCSPMLWRLLWVRRNIGRALPGECPCAARPHLPGPTASGVVFLKWVWMGGEVRGRNGCPFSRRSAPVGKGRCSVSVPRKPGWRPLDRCQRGLWPGLKVRLSSRDLRRAGTTCLPGLLCHAGDTSLVQVAHRWL